MVARKRNRGIGRLQLPKCSQQSPLPRERLVWDQAAGKVTCGPKKGQNASRLSACRYVQLEVTSTATDSTRRPAVSLSGAVERTRKYEGPAVSRVRRRVATGRPSRSTPHVRCSQSQLRVTS